MDDNALLRQFIEEKSDDAFAALVKRHIHFVYSIALRQTAHPQMAEEITQAAFIILARKAAGLRHEKALSSWLFQTTRLTANNLLRSEIRRQNREQEAFMQSALNEPENASWQQIAPLLDEAVAAMREKDRRAILLRFYEGKNLRDVGAALGTNEDAAQKRVERALEKLRTFFTKRGIRSTATTITEAISANSLQLAPEMLIATIASSTVKGSTTAASTLSLVKTTLKLMTYAKIKLSLGIAGAILLVAGTATVAISQINNGQTASPLTPYQTNIQTQKPDVPVVADGDNAQIVADPNDTAIATGFTNNLNSDDKERNTALQRAFDQFPLFTPSTNADGQLDFQTLPLADPVVINHERFFGFRFTVPARAHHEDLVWGFALPGDLKEWYIVPQTGSMEGFENYNFTSKGDYLREKPLLPMNANRLILQHLAGDRLKDGQTYLIWFGFGNYNAPGMSVIFTFTNFDANPPHPIISFERALALNELDSKPVVNPANHHTYMLLRPTNWQRAEKLAEQLGGHLATVRNQAEEDWIFDTFGHYGGCRRSLWIGLNDLDKRFHFSWAGGESASYTDWAPYEPNNAGPRGEDYVAIYYPGHAHANEWRVWNSRRRDPGGPPMDGVVEIIPNTATSSAPVVPVANTAPVQILPNVTVTSTSGSIELAWPLSAAGYILEATTNLSQPFAEFGYSEETNTQDGVIYVNITNPAPQMFFKLKEIQP